MDAERQCHPKPENTLPRLHAALQCLPTAMLVLAHPSSCWPNITWVPARTTQHLSASTTPNALRHSFSIVGLLWVFAPRYIGAKKPIPPDNDILTIPKRIGTAPCRCVTYICTQRHQKFLAICDVTTGYLHPQNDIPCLTVLQGRRSIWLSSGNLCLTHETHYGHRTITGQQQHERNHKTPREGNPSKIPSLFVSEPLASSREGNP